MQMIKKVAMTLSMTLSIPAMAAENFFIPPECLPDKCYCYYPQAVDKLAEQIESCQKDRIELKAKTDWINEHSEKHPGGISWWQEPQAIVGGIVISASIASVVTMWTMYRLSK